MSLIIFITKSNRKNTFVFTVFEIKLCRCKMQYTEIILGIMFFSLVASPLYNPVIDITHLVIIDVILLMFKVFFQTT
ncbi:hypothetical protein A0H76_648 [Hepatospora eriocheir]|uniref:Uncharacterized protein n=1 Tax=Hepatospora eriocheir TaxID=1081669 RepID=A0A1X0Q7H6_9MICR|nr:hypothetical protein A0H76_648 [Hepatospora eriocheir]